jgi:DNA-binding response OmpR family regulator
MSGNLILVADDDKVLSGLITTFLTKQGLEVRVTFDALQTWMVALRTRPAAILLDIKMPGGTGLDVLKRLKGSTKTNGIPVIAISAVNDPALPTKAKSLGAAEFMAKPLDLAQVYEVLCRLLGKAPPPAVPMV